MMILITTLRINMEKKLFFTNLINRMEQQTQRLEAKTPTHPFFKKINERSSALRTMQSSGNAGHPQLKSLLENLKNKNIIQED